MKNDSPLCKTCGAPLQDGGTLELCPKCLLSEALSATQPGEDETTLDGAVPAADPGLGTVRYFGDYELLEEIARGGMGVVYKARQRNLNRVVAVKMILSGSMAGEAEVKRFRAEAEAAAHLQHPNIVAIHEVGLHEGLHYFSMDFIEGPNLTGAMAAKTFSPIEIAECVKKIADAIQYAHQRGILHRDLKPANILIDSAGEPRVTDFGLARKLDEDSGATRTGAVMGSPAYMPPEQATGRQDRIGPHSDVYSLGAILYEMLAGKPPFRCDTIVETLRQVADIPAVPPSKLKPNVSRDLETICLKCLEKQPERRYGSARQLSEDLARFINAEPVLARPAGSMRKTWSWLQRHPWALAGGASVLVLALIMVSYGFFQKNHYLHWKIAHPGQKYAAHRPNDNWMNDSVMRGKILAGWAICALWLSGPLLFADFITRKGRKASFTRARLAAYGVGGGLEMAVGLAVMLLFVKGGAWSDDSGELEAAVAAALFMAFPCWWFGANLIWYVLQEQRQNEFGPSRGLPPALFAKPEAKPDPSGLQTVYRLRWQILLWFLVMVVVRAVRASLASGESRGKVDNFCIALVCFVGFLECLRQTLKSARADRHFHILGAVVCGFATIAIGLVCLNENVFITSYAPAIATGLAFGMVFQKLRKHAPPINPEDFKPGHNGKLAWTEQNPKPAGTIVLGLLALAYVCAGLATGNANLGVVLFTASILPGAVTELLRARNQARKARAVGLLGLLTIVTLFNQFAHRALLWMAPAFFLVGAAILAWQLNWEKRRAEQPANQPVTK